jgi:KaiC/GvpD/RAD55 family RecA-like ATPase
MQISFDIQDAKFSPYMMDSIIALMIRDTDFLAKCFYLVKAKTFTNERRVFVELCYNYFEKYKEAPAEYMDDILEGYTSKKPSQKKLLDRYWDKLFDLEPNADYVRRTFGGFVKGIVCSNGIMKADDLVKKGKIKEAEDAILESFREAYALTGKTVENYLTVQGGGREDRDMINFKSFIEPYDKKTGGFYRKEMVLLMGDSSIGKSWLLVYIGKIAILQGKKVLHITLETSKEEIEDRYDATMTSSKVRRYMTGSEGGDFNYAKLAKKKQFLRRKGGALWIHQATNFSFEDLVSLVNSIEIVLGDAPDVIIFDSPDQAVSQSVYKDYWLDEKMLYKKILDFTKDRNITMFVTTWTTKGSEGKHRHKGSDVSGSVDKVRIPDTRLSMNQTEGEKFDEIVRLHLFYSRFVKKGFEIKIQQNLDIGQPVMSAELVDDVDQQHADAKRVGKKYGLIK